jgi:hypothetical protein
MTMRTDLSNSEYHAHDAISSSDVKMVAAKSLAHWKAKVYKPSATFDMGTAVHAMVLEPNANLILRGPEDRRGNKWKDAQADAEANGQTLLTTGDYDLAHDIASSVIMHPIARELHGQDIINEASFFAHDPDTGLAIKTRPDALSERTGIIYDLKTCQSANPRDFARDILSYGYHVQSAFYLHTLWHAGFTANDFMFVCVEKTAPYAISVNVLSPEYLAYGRAQMKAALSQIRNADDTGYTTGWSDDVNTIDIPRWLDAPVEFN